MTKEKVIEELKEMIQTESNGYHRSALNAAISMLQNATIWTLCEDRYPQVDDADAEGNVNVLFGDGSTGCTSYMTVSIVSRKTKTNLLSNMVIAWSRIEPIQGGGL